MQGSGGGGLRSLLLAKARALAGGPRRVGDLLVSNEQALVSTCRVANVAPEGPLSANDGNYALDGGELGRT